MDHDDCSGNRGAGQAGHARARRRAPATPAAIRFAAQCPDLDELIAVGLALHLFTEIVDARVSCRSPICTGRRPC